jgi:hypothetical protein
MLQNLQVKRYLSRLINGDYALEAVTLPPYPTLDARTATVATKTADYTVTIADLEAPTIFDNAGDAGTQVLTLPAVALAKGKVIRAHALAAQIIRLDPQAGEAVNYNGSAVVSKYVNLAGVIGNYIELFCDGTQWVVTQSNGVVTKEA